MTDSELSFHLTPWSTSPYRLLRPFMHSTTLYYKASHVLCHIEKAMLQTCKSNIVQNQDIIWILTGMVPVKKQNVENKKDHNLRKPTKNHMKTLCDAFRGLRRCAIRLVWLWLGQLPFWQFSHFSFIQQCGDDGQIWSMSKSEHALKAINQIYAVWLGIYVVWLGIYAVSVCHLFGRG